MHENNSFTFKNRLGKNLFRLQKRNPSKSSWNKYKLIMAGIEQPVTSYFKFNRGKLYRYKNHV